MAGAKVAALRAGQVNATEEGVFAHVRPALRHRLILNFEAGADEVSADDILEDLIKSLE